MKTILIATAVMTLAMSVNAQNSYPGSAWANMTGNPSVVKNSAEEGNILLQGRVEQGMIIGHVGDFRVNAFGAVNYSVDRNGLDYNNKIAPMVGVKMQRDLGSNGIVEFGVQAVHENHFRATNGSPSNGTGVQAFVSFWSGWDLRK